MDQRNFYFRALANISQNNLVPIYEVANATYATAKKIDELIPAEYKDKVGYAVIYISNAGSNTAYTVSFTNAATTTISLTPTVTPVIVLNNASQIANFKITSGTSPVSIVFYIDVTLI